MRNHVCTVALVALLAGCATSDRTGLDRLNESPRHHEWVDVDGDQREIRTFVVYPEVAEKVPVVLVIHENRGLNDWARGLADQLAGAGYIAVAPDLLSGMAPGGGDTADFADRNAARDAIYELNSDQVMGELSAIAEWARTLSASNGKLVVAGFCWGGHQSFQFATINNDIEAAFVFYGTPAEDEALKDIQAPVYGFYGGNDARVTATVDPTIRKMDEAGKTYKPVIYAGAGHGFMRSGEEPGAEEANVEARRQAWARWLDLLDRI